jgi:hypothetical protein
MRDAHTRKGVLKIALTLPLPTTIGNATEILRRLQIHDKHVTR